MGTTVNTVAAGQRVVAAEELARLLMDTASAKAPAGGKRRRPEEEAVANPAAEDAAEAAQGKTQEVDPAASESKAPAAKQSAAEDSASAEGETAGSPGGDQWTSDDVRGESFQVAQAGGAPGGSAGVVSAAGEEGAGFGIPLLLLGGGAAALAALDNDGGGGTPAPAPTAAPGPIANFVEFHAQAGGETPMVVDATGASATEVFIISGGFDRAILPDTLSNLAPDLVYDLAHNLSLTGTVDYKGLEVNLTGGAGLLVAAIASAEATGSAESDIVWLANLGAVGTVTGSAGAAVGALAGAVDGGDAEVGISNLYVDVAGTGSVVAAAVISADAGTGSTARVLIGANVAVSAAGDQALAGVLVQAFGVGEVDIAGDVSLAVSASASATTATASAEFLAWDSASITVGDVSLSVGANGSGFLDIFADDDAAEDAFISVGNIDLTLGDGASADIKVQQPGFTTTHFTFSTSTTFTTRSSDAEVDIGNVSASVGDGGQANFYIRSVTDDDGRTADFDGLGNVFMELGEPVLNNGEQTFGSIDVSGLAGDFDLRLNFGDDAFGTSVGDDIFDVPSTVINGFNKPTDSLVFNNDPADALDFEAIAAQTTPGGLFTALNDNLDGTIDYVFAEYDGADITGDGLAETDLGVLAYDTDGVGITSVLLLPGVITMTPDDLN